MEYPRFHMLPFRNELEFPLFLTVSKRAAYFNDPLNCVTSGCVAILVSVLSVADHNSGLEDQTSASKTNDRRLKPVN